MNTINSGGLNQPHFEQYIPSVARILPGIVATELTVRKAPWNEPDAVISKILSDMILEASVKPIARKIDRLAGFNIPLPTLVQKPAHWITKIKGITFKTKTSADKNFPFCSIGVPGKILSKIGVSDTNDRIVLFSADRTAPENENKWELLLI
ncbi:MAG: hypothetical protein J7K00_03025 [Candidatus Diapherotrites archaeon]|nr:hypothetical protein [Candidatus Diapherotrites archaeon]